MKAKKSLAKLGKARWSNCWNGQFNQCAPHGAQATAGRTPGSENWHPLVGPTEAGQPLARMAGGHPCSRYPACRVALPVPLGRVYRFRGGHDCGDGEGDNRIFVIHDDRIDNAPFRSNK
jgi:hypothetical protein